MAAALGGFVVLAALAITSMASSAATTPYAPAVLADSPAAYWRLGERSGTVAASASPSAIAATYVNNPGKGIAGALVGDPDTAISLSGSSYAEAPASAVLNATRLTVEGWARVTGGSGRQRAVVVSRSSNNLAGYALFAGSDNRWAFSVGNGSSVSWNVVSGPALTLNKWTHLVGTFDGSTARLYVDGAQAAAIASGYAPNLTRTTRVGMGASDTGTSWSFVGSLDEVAIYPTALTAARISLHAALGVTAAPVNTVLPKITGTAKAGSVLTATSGTWTGTAPTLTTQWSRCNAVGAACVAIAGATGASYTLVATDVGATFRTVVTATNAAGTVTATSAQTAVVTAVKPASTALPAISGTAGVGFTLTASAGTWSGTAPIAFAYQWKRCKATGASCVVIAGATAVGYAPVAADVGSTLRVDVTASNGAGSALATSVQTAAIAAAAVAPANTALPTLTGAATVGSTLTATAGTWSGTAPISTAFGWKRCDAGGATCVAIAGATAATYLLTAADGGSAIRVAVTATNAGGSAVATSAASTVVGGGAVAPVNSVLPTITGAARTGSTLTATTGTWTGATTTARQWLRCPAAGTGCAAIGGATAATYTLVPADAGATIRVDVTATNAVASTVASSPVTALVDVGYADAVRADAPRSWWRLDETAGTAAADAAGARNATYLRSPTLGQPGALGADSSTSAKLDGVTQYAETPYAAALNPAGPFSLEAWVKVTGGLGTGRSIVTSRDWSGSPFGYALYAGDGDRWQFLLGTTTGWVDVEGSPVVLNQWTHVVATYDTWPTEARLYVNGTLVGVSTSTFTFAPNTSKPLRLGSGSTESAPTYFLPGQLDEVAIYGTALTPARVAAHYRTGTGVHDVVPPAAANLVQAENQLAGSAGWKRPPTTTVEGYTSEVSVLPGGSLHLHVSAAAGTRYRIEVYRLGWYAGAGARLVGCLPDCATDEAGALQPVPPADPTTGEIVAGWPVTDTLAVGAAWPSGVYVASLLATSGAEAGRSSMVPFVVREAAVRKSAVLVQLAVNTWQAYNNWGGKSLYNANSTGANLALTGTPAAVKVSFDRPYRSGGAPMWPWEAYSGVPTVWDWDVQLVRFLEREGYDVSYTTDVDTDADPASLLGRKVVMPSGHDEYWSKVTYDALFAARDAGVNLAFVGGNIGGAQIRYEDGGRTIVEYRAPELDPNPDPAQKTATFQTLGRPECTLLGVGIREGVATQRGDYNVVAGSLGDPLFAGTSFVAGATLPWGVGYEWDGIVPGCAVPTPTSYFHFDSAWGPADVTRYTAASGARVFSASSLQFSWLLDDFLANQPADARVQQFMRNVLADMLR